MAVPACYMRRTRPAKQTWRNVFRWCLLRQQTGVLDVKIELDYDEEVRQVLEEFVNDSESEIYDVSDNTTPFLSQSTIVSGLHLQCSTFPNLRFLRHVNLFITP